MFKISTIPSKKTIYQNTKKTVFYFKTIQYRLDLIFITLLLQINLTPIFGQTNEEITLDQAIQIAKANNPRLKIAENNLLQSKTSRAEIVEIAPTSFSYSWGQLNGENKKDKELSFEQNIGSIITPFYKNALVNRQIKSGEWYKQLVEKEIIAEVKRAWTNYQYASSLNRIYRNQDKQASELQQLGELRHQRGEMTLLEKNMLTTLVADLHKHWYEAREEKKAALYRLRWTCNTNRLIIPADSILSLFSMQKQINQATPSTTHTHYFEAQVDEVKAMVNIERSRFFPEITMGYNLQNMLPLKNLSSWTIGFSFPIYFLPQKSKIKQAKIALHSARIQAEANIRELTNKIIEIEASIRRYNEILRFYTSTALKEAQQLKESADLQLKDNKINMSDYIQSIHTAIEINRGYIETVNLYNIAVLEYELYKD